MSRTTRRTVRGKTVRDGAWTAKCPERDCDWCADSRQHAGRLAAVIATEKVMEACA